MQDSNKKLRLITLALCLVTAAVYLFFPLHVGMQDSGALSHIENGLAVEKANSTFENGNYTELKYRPLEGGNTGKYTGASALYLKPMVAAAKALHLAFDLRFLGLFYLALMLAAVYLVLKYAHFQTLWQRILLAALVYFVFFDVAYLVYLNSLYTEAGFLVFLMLACGLYVKLAFSEKPQKPSLVLYYLCAFLLCGMKPNMGFAGVFFALMGLRLLPLDKGRLFRALNIALALTVAVPPLFQFRDIIPAGRQANLYNAVFYGILKDNENPQEALKELGLDQSLAAYAGTAAFQTDLAAPELQTQFFDKIGYGDVAGYYLKNPGVFLDKLKIAANNAFENRPRYLGNYTADSGRQPTDLAGGFSLYSNVKRRLFPAKLGFVLAFAALMIAGALYLRKKAKTPGAKAFCDAAALLSLFSICLFPVPVITFGESELVRHMGVYAMLFDVLFVTAVCGAGLIVTGRRAALKEKYGVEQ